MKPSSHAFIHKCAFSQTLSGHLCTLFTYTAKSIQICFICKLKYVLYTKVLLHLSNVNFHLLTKKDLLEELTSDINIRVDSVYISCNLFTQVYQYNSAIAFMIFEFVGANCIARVKLCKGICQIVEL